MNAHLAKILVKGAASIIVSMTLGYIYKGGKKIDERIDDYFAEPKPEEQNN